MWTTLKKSIMSKIVGFDGTRRWKCIIVDFSCRRYSFKRWNTRIHNNFIDNLFNFIIAILSQYSLIMQILFFAVFSWTDNRKNVEEWTPIILETSTFIYSRTFLPAIRVGWDSKNFCMQFLHKLKSVKIHNSLFKWITSIQLKPTIIHFQQRVPSKPPILDIIDFLSVVHIFLKSEKIMTYASLVDILLTKNWTLFSNFFIKKIACKIFAIIFFANLYLYKCIRI